MNFKNIFIKDINADEFIDDFYKMLSYEISSNNLMKEDFRLLLKCLENRNEIKKNNDFSKLRSTFISFFQTDSFKDIYKSFFLKLANSFKKDQLLFQIQPTPRLVGIDALATSFHCDKWYGHGTDTYTVWVPLHEVKNGSGVSFIVDKNLNKDLHHDFLKETDHFASLNSLNSKCSNLAKEFAPKNKKARIFHSSVLHGSPYNSSGETRFSLDFRFSVNVKNIGSKNFSDFFYLDRNYSEKKIRPYQEWPLNFNFLKYVNGETGISTRSQHLLIEAFCEDLGLKITGQEAEIEDGNLSVLKHYLNKNNLKKSGFDGIIISSTNLLPNDLIKTSNSYILSAFERRII